MGCCSRCCSSVGEFVKNYMMPKRLFDRILVVIIFIGFFAFLIGGVVLYENPPTGEYLGPTYKILIVPFVILVFIALTRNFWKCEDTCKRETSEEPVTMRGIKSRTESTTLVTSDSFTEDGLRPLVSEETEGPSDVQRPTSTSSEVPSTKSASTPKEDSLPESSTHQSMEESDTSLSTNLIRPPVRIPTEELVPILKDILEEKVDSKGRTVLTCDAVERAIEKLREEIVKSLSDFEGRKLLHVQSARKLLKDYLKDMLIVDKIFISDILTVYDEMCDNYSKNGTIEVDLLQICGTWTGVFENDLNNFHPSSPTTETENQEIQSEPVD